MTMQNKDKPALLALNEAGNGLLRIDKATARKAWRSCVPVLSAPSAHPDVDARELPVPDAVMPCDRNDLDNAVRATWPGQGLIGARFFVRDHKTYVLHLEFADGSNPYVSYLNSLAALLKSVSGWSRNYGLARLDASVPNQFTYMASAKRAPGNSLQ